MGAVVIVGASHAAAEAVTTLRRKGWEGDILLVGDEEYLPYQRPPLSKKYFNDELGAEQLFIKNPEVYNKARVDQRLGWTAKAIDRSGKTLSLENARGHTETIDYEKLILATGTRARMLPVPGADLPQIHYLRTKSDVDGIKSALSPSSRLLIVGAGYIGLEVAASAVKQGMKVTVVEAMDRVLARVTSPAISEFYQRIHSEEGVDIRLSTALQGFESSGSGITAVLGLDEGGSERLQADAVIVGIGVLPNVELAEAAGLTCDNGIQVDEFCRTSDPDIYAVGDCCNHPSFIYERRLRLESVPNAVDQARTACQAICGEDQPYDQVPWFWSDQYDVKLQTVGLLQGFDQQVVRGDSSGRKFSVFYLKGGRLIAMDALNSPLEFITSKKLVAARACPDPEQLADENRPIKELLA